MEVTPVGVARFYGPGLLDGFVLDEADATLAPEVEALGIPALVVPTWMRSQDDRIRLAEVVLDWGSALIERG
jgi:LPPG:FO 2-phospho-L-lactate transferase